MKSIRRAIVVVKRTALGRLKTSKKKTDIQFWKLVEKGHPSTRAIRLAHEEHLASLKMVRRELRNRNVSFVERTRMPKSMPRGIDLVITVGGDGTLLDASHFVRGDLMILGVNSAPTSSVGFLTACRAPTFAQTLDAVVAGELVPLEVQRLMIRLGRKVLPEPVLNDVLFCHDNPAVVTRYRIETPHADEIQQSSGIWVSTAAGSTAAFRSAGGTPMSLTSKSFGFIVREPYGPPGSAPRLTSALLEPSQSLHIESRVDSASLFIDGSYRRYAVSYGDHINFSLHSSPLLLIRPTVRR